MKKTNRRRILENEKGFAMLEAIPLVVVFVVLTSFGLGFFGLIHTSVLHSIAARTYAFETFRQRTNLNFFRENTSGLTRPLSFANRGWRIHGVQAEGDTRNNFIATPRPIAVGRSIAEADANDSTHNQQIFQLQPRNERVSVNPAWVMVAYGICLNASCGN